MSQQKTLSSHPRSAIWFLIIGALAALVHYVVAVALAAWVQVAPSAANIVGFMCAFPLSYFGHRTFSFPASFPAQHQQNNQTLPKFLLIAIGGFLANQSLLLLGLHFTSMPFWLLLALVMVIVAITTYVLSRFWAFKS